MPRPLRIQYPGAIYLVTNRGSGRQAIFEDAADARSFLDLLGDVAGALGWRCYAYCLMSDHYRLVVRTEQPNLSQGMQAFAGRYTQAFNRRHARDGQLFRGRFKAIVVERESYLVPLVRNVVLAPVLAGLVQDPGAWRWSSYRAMTGAAPAPPFLDTAWMIGPYAFAQPQAREAWRAHVADGLAQRETLRELEAKLRNRSILGAREFVREVRRKATRGATARATE